MLIVGRVFFLQILSGDRYASLAESNRLARTLIFSQRGPIYDRNGVVLAWNESQQATTTATTSTPVDETFSFRKYDPDPSLSHILGYVRYPKVDSNGYYIQNAIVGVEGVEEVYDSLLAGEQGQKISERDALGNRTADSTIIQPTQ